MEGVRGNLENKGGGQGMYVEGTLSPITWLCMIFCEKLMENIKLS